MIFKNLETIKELLLIFLIKKMLCSTSWVICLTWQDWPTSNALNMKLSDSDRFNYPELFKQYK